MTRTRGIQISLLSLVVLDVVLSGTALLAPGVWFSLFHGVPYVDPQGFLRRCAANWAAFALFQGIAYFKWQKQPHWLVLVAGLRFSDIFTDWTYLHFAANVTAFGWISLAFASPMNLVAGLFFMKRYGERGRTTS